jgi:hypothetical protein
MSVYEEISAGWTTMDMDALIGAVCALADEVRALRILKEQQIAKPQNDAREAMKIITDAYQSSVGATTHPPALATADYLKSTAPPPFASTAPFPFVTQAKSERLQYPYCEACESFHHPDYFMCKKLQPVAQCADCNHPRESHVSDGTECMASDCHCSKYTETPSHPSELKCVTCGHPMEYQFGPKCRIHMEVPPIGWCQCPQFRKPQPAAEPLNPPEEVDETRLEPNS